MKRLLSAIALTCILAVSTLAGDLPTSGVPSPAPGGATQTTSSTSPGDMPTVGEVDQASASGALSVLMTILGLI